MSYQALLFCPDEKTARTVTQVLGELDFNVTACTEPFAAVKKFMGERFDAVVVDCENEQNATLLFKSARSAPNNQGALAVAIVEGQAGVAKAFRIGANLVLTKPINVEQTKGTLRVARGLLRKNEAGKPANGIVAGAAPSKASAAGPAPVRPASQPLTPSPTEARIAATVATEPANVTPMSRPAASTVVGSSAAGSDEQTSEFTLSGKHPHNGDSISSPSSSPSQTIPPAPSDLSFPPKIVSAEIHPQGSLSSGSAASAPAPAREPKRDTAADSTSISESADQAVKTDSNHDLTSRATISASTHTLTFGGTVGSGAKGKSSAGKNALIGAVAAILVAAGSYAAWMKWNSLKMAVAAPTSVATRPTRTVAPAPVVPAPAPQSAPRVAETQPADVQTPAPQNIENHKTEIQKPSKSSKPENHFANENGTPKESKEDVSGVAENALPASTPAPQPIVIRSDNGKAAPKPAESTDAPTLSMTAIAPSGDALPKLGPAATATPVLQRVVVSQGVSRGLLIKEVQPVYPSAALAMRIEGSVQLMATIAKTGNISEVKAMSGDKELASAAIAAVKQWKYKPYLLNGEPVEIQTQITVNFKLPR